MTSTAEPRTVFTSSGYRYEIYDTQVRNQDYDTLLLAWRQSIEGGSRSQVILKPFPVDSEGERRERAWEEVQLATHLDRSSIAKVHGIAKEDEKKRHVVMEYVPGLYLLTALDFALLLGRKLSPPCAAYIAAIVADALDYAHQRKDREGRQLHIIHRAVGPMRVRLGFDGSVKLANFGAAYSELRDRLQSPPGLLRGDPAYTAPEIWRAVMASHGSRSDPLSAGTIDGRADVFSLGLVLLEMLLAEYPLDPSDVGVSRPPPGFAAGVKTERPTWSGLDVLAHRVLRFNPETQERRLERVPAGLRSVVIRALQPDPAARYDAGAMRDELGAYLGSLGHPFGAEEMSSELKSIFGAAKTVERFLANPIERTALSRDEERVFGQ